MDYEDHEKTYEEIKEKNAVYLEEFWQDLEKAGLKENTMQSHYTNADLISTGIFY